MASFSASLLVLAATLFVACGDGNATNREHGHVEDVATDDELLARASAALRLQVEDPSVLSSGRTYSYIPALAYADLAAAREQLGLAADAAIRPRTQRLLFTFAARPLFMFSLAFRADPSLGPLGEVLDGGQIEAAAGTNFALSGPGSDEIGPDDVLVLRTRQPFGQIANRLRQLGYEDGLDGLLVAGEPLPEPDDEVRRAPSYDGVPFPAVGDAGEGVVAMGGSERAVRAALEGADEELSEVAALVATLPGVSRAARGFDSRDCVVAVGLGESAAPREGELVIVVDGEAEARRHHFGGLTWPATFFSNEGGPEASDGEIAFAQAIAKGERAIAPFTSTDETNATRLGVEDIDRPYDCP